MAFISKRREAPMRPRRSLYSLVATLAVSTGAMASEQQVPCDAVPALIRAAFAKSYLDVSPKTCVKEVVNHRTTSYEIAGQDGAVIRKAVISADGKLVSLEETIPLAEVPHPVQQAVKTRYPDAAITSAERVTYPALSFELFLRHRGKVVQVAVDAGGSQVKEVKD